MHFPIAESIVAVAAAYVATGAVVALAFLVLAIENFAPAAKGSYLVRAVIAPGLVLLWPLVVARWIGLVGDRMRPPSPRSFSFHLTAWLCIAILAPAILAVAYMQSRVSLPASPSVRLSEQATR